MKILSTTVLLALVAMCLPMLADSDSLYDRANAEAEKLVATAMQEKESFSLFDGKTLEGWYPDVPDADDKPDIEPSFIVRDGNLVSKGRPLGHLISKKSFKDYRLEVQYRFAGKPGNCGVLVHTDGKRPRVLYKMFPASIEVQMQHNQAGDFWCIHENISVANMDKRRGPDPSKYGGKQGQKRHIRNLTDGSEKPLGEWNTMIIETLGNTIRVWVNGDLVNDGFDATASEGQIALQAEGAEVEFRKLEMTPITKLTPAKNLRAAASKEKLKLLLIDGQNNHNWVETSPVILDILNAPGRFEVERATVVKGEAKDFKPDFTKYDAVVMNYVGEMWPKETQAGLETYMKEGGGLVIIHAANNAFPKWKEYNRMTALGGWGGRNEKDGPYVYWKDGEFVRDDSPGRGGAHGRHWEYTVDLRDKEHPITKGLPANFMMAKEELYDRLRGPAENMTVLATSFADPETNGSGRHEPVLMTIDYGKGRVFHTTLGHSGKSMLGVAFQETLNRGTEWAATGEVTFPDVSAEVLPADRAASRDPKDIPKTH